MPDISMCKNKTCPSRVHCYRYRAKPNKYLQAYGNFDPNGKDRCDKYSSASGWDDFALVPMSALKIRERGE